jgi:hypothetical protein
MSDRTRKLAVIHAKTDHDLEILVQRELDRGFALLELATTRNSPLFAQAGKEYETATTLLSKIIGLSESDRERIESKLKELRSRLDRVPAVAAVNQYRLSVAS